MKNCTSLCALAGCNKPRFSSGVRLNLSAYCTTHRHKNAQGGTIRKRGQKATVLVGSSHIIKSGHRVIGWAGEQFLVHRIVDFITNGPLPKGYVVHHKDRNPRNNHWNNLQRMSRAEHTHLHKTEFV